MRAICVPLLLLLALPPLARAGTAEEYTQEAREAFGKRQWGKAVELTGKAIALDPKYAPAYDLRGNAHFMQGKFKESVADFDAFLKLQPKKRNEHWRRGISLYYAGKYEEGRKQFEAYQKVSTVDVENGVWHFLCAARKDGVKKARKAMLPIGKDERAPMNEVYELFKGKAKPEDVLKAAREGEKPDERSRFFYAHLYLGLYFDAMGDPKKAREHMKLAAGKYRMGHYMGEVARVHLEVLEKKDRK
jgi:lipoprotein NlpI